MVGLESHILMIPLMPGAYCRDWEERYKHLAVVVEHCRDLKVLHKPSELFAREVPIGMRKGLQLVKHKEMMHSVALYYRELVHHTKHKK